MSTILKLLVVVISIGGYFAKNLAEQKIYYDLDDAENIFNDFIIKYNKHYQDKAEYVNRFEIFKLQLKKLNELNAKYANTVYGINHFSDLTFEEFAGKYTGLQINHSAERTTYEPVGNAPDALDYRKDGYVTEVKNQKHCGSCFAFSAVGAIEGAYAIKHKQLVSLSEQQALDCSKGDCILGGLLEDAIDGVAAKGGAVGEKDYPYVARKGVCNTDTSKIIAKVTGSESLSIANEEDLKDALANYGPLAIGLQVNAEFSNYQNAVFDGDCKQGNITGHGVLLVGYGHDGEDFWIIKNSWSENWGEQGYIRMVRGQKKCEIGHYVVKAKVD